MKLRICLFFLLFCSTSFTQNADSLNFKIIFADGFSGDKIEVYINHNRVLNKTLFSSNQYGLTGEEIEIYSKELEVIVVKQLDQEYKIRSEKGVFLHISTGEIKFQYEYLDNDIKYLVVYKKEKQIFISEFTTEPGFD